MEGNVGTSGDGQNSCDVVFWISWKYTSEEIDVSGSVDGGDVDGSFSIESLEDAIEVLHGFKNNIIDNKPSLSY